MKKESYYFSSEALERAEEIAKENGAQVVKCTCDCSTMPLPDELDNWSGETAGFAVEKGSETIAKIAWWDSGE